MALTPRQARRNLLGGTVLLVGGAAGFLGLPVLQGSGNGTRTELADLKPRPSDMSWGNPTRADGRTLMILSSLTCRWCEEWEDKELPGVLAGAVARGDIAFVLRDSPRDTDSLVGAMFLSGIADRDARLALRVQVRADMRGVLARASQGKMGEEARVAAARVVDRDAAQAFRELAEADVRLFDVRGTPTFLMPGTLPLMGYRTGSELLSRMMSAGARPATD